MNETRIIIFAMQWTSLGSCSNSFTKATSLCGHVSFELKRRNGTKKKRFCFTKCQPQQHRFSQEQHGKSSLKESRIRCPTRCVDYNPKKSAMEETTFTTCDTESLKTPPSAKSHIMRESQHILSAFPMSCKGSIWDHRFGSNAPRFDRWCLAFATLG